MECYAKVARDAGFSGFLAGIAQVDANISKQNITQSLLCTTVTAALTAEGGSLFRLEGGWFGLVGCRLLAVRA